MSHQDERELAQFAGLIRELEQLEQDSRANAIEPAFRRRLRSRLVAGGTASLGMPNVWTRVGRVAGTTVMLALLLAAAAYFWLALGPRSGELGPAALQATVVPRASQTAPEAGAGARPAQTEESAQDDVWIVSATQAARTSLDAPVSFDVTLGYRLESHAEALLKLHYAAPEWEQTTGGRVPVDGMSELLPIQRGTGEVTIFFNESVALMDAIVGTQHPVLMVQMGALAEGPAGPQLDLFVLKTFADQPFNLASRAAIDYVRAAPDQEVAFVCQETEPVLDEPPRDPNADPFGEGYWYVNEDRTLWSSLPGSEMWSPEAEKVIWIRPAGEALVITGQRLDAEAPPLEASIPCCYPTGFQITGITFPTPGCWDIVASAGKHELHIVTEVFSSTETVPAPDVDAYPAP